MFLRCDTPDAPWTVFKRDGKKRARLNAMRFVLHRMPYASRELATVGAVDALIVGRPSLASSAGDDQFATSSGQRVSPRADRRRRRGVGQRSLAAAERMVVSSAPSPARRRSSAALVVDARIRSRKSTPASTTRCARRACAA